MSYKVEAWVCPHRVCVFVFHLTTVCFSSSMPSIGSPVTRVSIHLLSSHFTKYTFTAVESNETIEQRRLFSQSKSTIKLRRILGNVFLVTCRLNKGVLKSDSTL